MRSSFVVALCVGLLAGATAGHADPKPPVADGDWQGNLATPDGRSLRLALHVTRDAKGALAATVMSLDQGARSIAASAVKLEGRHLVVTLTTPPAELTGDLDDAGQLLTAQWHQGTASLPLAMHRGTAAGKPAAERARPQTPVPPFPYRAEEVAYDHAAAHVRLAGTLLIPDGAGPFPAALLITGSGPQDRDESLLGHKPFLVLADALARHGIAVLRVDDRGIGASTGTFTGATTEDFAGDAAAGVAYLRTRKEVDGRHIGLVGHSEGAVIAPMLAARDKQIAYIVLLAGPGQPGEELLLAQGDLIARASGQTDEAALKQQRDDKRQLFDLVKREKDAAVLEPKARALIAAALARATPAEKQALGDPEAAVRAALAPLMSPWFRYFIAYDPQIALAKVHCPVLAINGAKDLQVPAKDNLAGIARALKAAGNRDVTIRELPGLNHLFQTATTGSPSEYAAIDETMAPSVLALVGDWIAAHAKK